MLPLEGKVAALCNVCFTLC